MSDQADTSAELEAIRNEILSRPGTEAPEKAPEPPAVTEREAAPPTEKQPSEAALALARIAELDAQLAALRKEREAPRPPPEKPKRTSVTAEDLRYNPMAALAELGINDEVLAQFLVAKHAGPNAPVDLRVQAALMPQLGAIREQTRGDVEALRARLEEYEAREAQRTFQASMQKALSGISSEKFPTLSRALAADADGTTADLLKAAEDRAKAAGGTSGSSIDEVLTQVEAMYATLAKRIAPPAPAASTQGSTPKPATTTRSAPPATMANLSGVPPKAASDLTHEEQLARLRDEILARS